MEKKSKTTDKEIHKALRVNLNKELTGDLEEIKKYYGIYADSDMIRFLIREHKKDIMKKEYFSEKIKKKD